LVDVLSKHTKRSPARTNNNGPSAQKKAPRSSKEVSATLSKSKSTSKAIKPAKYPKNASKNVNLNKEHNKKNFSTKPNVKLVRQHHFTLYSHSSYITFYLQVESMKPNWNTIRDRSTKEKAREAVVKKMVTQMTGRVLQVTLRHDASRMVQSILQFGTTEQKTLILHELAGDIYSMTSSFNLYIYFYHSQSCGHCQDALRPLHGAQGHHLLQP